MLRLKSKVFVRGGGGGRALGALGDLGALAGIWCFRKENRERNIDSLLQSAPSDLKNLLTALLNMFVNLSLQFYTGYILLAESNNQFRKL